MRCIIAMSPFYSSPIVSAGSSGNLVNTSWWHLQGVLAVEFQLWRKKKQKHSGLSCISMIPLLLPLLD